MDDAEHGAEQAEERRVVAERAEERQPAFELDLLIDRRAVHDLARRVGTALGVGDTRGDDLALERPRVRDVLRDDLQVAAPQSRTDRLALRGRHARSREHDPALDHQRELHCGQREQQVEHPRGSGSGEIDEAGHVHREAPWVEPSPRAAVAPASFRVDPRSCMRDLATMFNV